MFSLCVFFCVREIFFILLWKLWAIQMLDLDSVFLFLLIAYILLLSSSTISQNSEDCAAMVSLHCHWILFAAEHGSYKVATKSDKKSHIKEEQNGHGEKIASPREKKSNKRTSQELPLEIDEDGTREKPISNLLMISNAFSFPWNSR